VTTALRAGIVGLGAMGRHHVRALHALDGVDLVGIADRAGSNDGVGAAPVVPTVSQLIDLGVQMCIVAVPTDDHYSVGIELAEAGVHTLIEKPLSGDLAAARCLLEAFGNAGVVACVGHVERYNPALAELRRRLGEGQAGAVYQIATSRQGPFPHRVSDVGAVKDLATHDLDLTAWIADSSYAQVAAQTARRAGRAHEDLVAIVGLLQNGIVTNHLVNWLTPVKDRRVAVHGERGCFVADTLAAELVFAAHGHSEIAWDALSTIRGDSGGEVTRYEFDKREPLMLELAAFRDAILGRRATIVTLEEGLATVFVAEAVLRSAAAGSVIEISLERSIS
jgi:UDP-N-acetylglucosamine 3-dehydrogenase